MLSPPTPEYSADKLSPMKNYKNTSVQQRSDKIKRASPIKVFCNTGFQVPVKLG